MEALLYDTEPCANRTGALVGMAACAISGGLVGFLFGVAVGVWL